MLKELKATNYIQQVYSNCVPLISLALCDICRVRIKCAVSFYREYFCVFNLPQDFPCVIFYFLISHDDSTPLFLLVPLLVEQNCVQHPVNVEPNVFIDYCREAWSQTLPPPHRSLLPFLCMQCRKQTTQGKGQQK